MTEVPSDERLEEVLRETTKTAWSGGEKEALTLNSVRLRTATELGIALDFFSKGDWKARSKSIVLGVVDDLEAEAEEEPQDQEEEGLVDRTKKNGSGKRKADEDTAPVNKKSRKGSISSSKTKAQESPSEEEPEAAPSDSDSSVLDSPPKSKNKGKSSKAKAKSDDSTNPQIKTLQSQLVKCGLRKSWAHELAPFSSASAKIAHLKSLLHSIGMTGRFSEARAKEIKEERELQADVEEVERVDKMWGAKGTDENSGATRTRRKAAPGSLKMQKIVIEGDSEEDEMDNSESDNDHEESDVDSDDDDDGSVVMTSEEEEEDDYGDESDDSQPPKKAKGKPKAKAKGKTKGKARPARRGRKAVDSDDESDEDTAGDDDSE